MNTLTFHDQLWSCKHILEKNESTRFGHSRPSDPGVIPHINYLYTSDYVLEIFELEIDNVI